MTQAWELFVHLPDDSSAQRNAGLGWFLLWVELFPASHFQQILASPASRTVSCWKALDTFLIPIQVPAIKAEKSNSKEIARLGFYGEIYRDIDSKAHE